MRFGGASPSLNGKLTLAGGICTPTNLAHLRAFWWSGKSPIVVVETGYSTFHGRREKVGGKKHTSVLCGQKRYS